jgi:hypothetical protein
MTHEELLAMQIMGASEEEFEYDGQEEEEMGNYYEDDRALGAPFEVNQSNISFKDEREILAND